MEIDANFDLTLVRTSLPYFATHSRYVFLTRVENVHTNSRRSTSKQNMRSRGTKNRETGLRRIGGSGNKVSRMSYLRGDLVADQRYHKNQNDMREGSRRNERLLGRMKEHILGNGAAAALADTAGVSIQRYAIKIGDTRNPGGDP